MWKMSEKSTDKENETSKKFKNFMGRTPSVIKSKFLSVLGNSTDIINGISNKIDAALSLSSSSETETTANRNQMKVDQMLRQKFEASTLDDNIDANMVDFEARRVKERRAHEEVLSGRYRHPTFISAATEPTLISIDPPTSNSTENSQGSNNSQSISSKSPQLTIDDFDITSQDFYRKTTPNISTNLQCSENAQPHSIILVDTLLTPNREKIKAPPSSASTSDNESYIPSGPMESDIKMWIRSESENSVPSWASSISLDSQSEEAILDFMRRFVNILFHDNSSITLELKSEFGQYARTESGRLWFSRLVNAQRVKTKRVDETTFYSLVQYFAIVLFECAESDDFSPAKSLMNMCFTFYHDIEVPGCEPYREYLYTYLRDQPIWHTLRFWNAAFFDALQCERLNRPVPPTKSTQAPSVPGKSSQVVDPHSLPISENDVSSTSSTYDKNDHSELQEDKKYQQNISFGQLGSFTCNMHAFGLSRELCTEFLQKQCIIANLRKEQQKLLEDNVTRMYRETDPWREN